MTQISSGLTAILALCLWFGCGLLTPDRLIYVKGGVEVHLQADPTVSRASPPARNEHPAAYPPRDIRTLLSIVRISGWSGTVVGLFARPPSIPLLTAEELDLLAPHLSKALAEARPDERVWFALAPRQTPYGEERTTAAFFLRGGNFHLVVLDHATFTRADTGGGDEKDPRDTKGMALSSSRPIPSVTTTRQQEPRWAPFETVHISLPIDEILRPSAEPGFPKPQTVIPLDPREPSLSPGRRRTDAPDPIQQQLDEQAQQIQRLQEELRRLQEQPRAPAPPSPVR